MTCTMSKIKLLSIAVIGLLAINIAVVGFLLLSKPPMPLNGMPQTEKKEGPKKIIIDKLHFDKEQIAAYEAIIVEHRESVKGLKDSISDTKNNLYQSLKTETFADKDSLINLLGALQKRIETVHYEHFVKIKKICKPQQMVDFNKLTNELAFYFTTEKKAILPPTGN
jgi:periplasmic protein CpxP/Spy